MQEHVIHVLSLDAFFYHFFYTAPKGLDWEELEKLLNPNFDWEAAVQTTLGTDDSLIEVCSLVVCLSYVYELSEQY